MRTKTFRISLLLFLLIALPLSAARKVISVEKVTSPLTLSEAVDYHITASDECIASSATINLAHEDAWVFFDNVCPSEVRSKWLSQLRVKGEPIVAQETAWINVYRHGAAVLPYAKDFAPLTVFTGELYGGEAKSYAPGRYKGLEEFDNAIKSFKLKRGYMITFAQGKDGSGYSRCFTAQDDDIEIPNLLDKKSCTNGGALYNKISFIRVMRLQMPAKKGAVDTDPVLTNCSWYYDYDSRNKSKSENIEYVNMWAHLWWNTEAQYGNASDISGVTHTLFFNEPWHGDDGGYMKGDPLAPLPYYKKLITNGMRIGSMAPAEPNLDKMYTFIDECDRLGLRVDFVAVHKYEYRDPQWWYSYTKQIYERTKRPVWITEFNNGANWTKEEWPGISWTTNEEGETVRQIDDLPLAREKQKEVLTKVCQKLDDIPWLERYSVFSWVEPWRGIIKEEIPGEATLAPAGEAYRDLQPGIAYNPAYEFVPVYPRFDRPAIKVTTNRLMTEGIVSITIKETSGEYLDRYVLEKKVGNGDYELVKETSEPSTSLTDVWDLNNPKKTIYRTTFYYCNETTPRFVEENTVDVDVAESAPVRYGTALFGKPDWGYIMYEPFEASKTGIPIFGGFPAASISDQANQFTYSLYSYLDKNNFRARIIPWGFVYNYNENSLNGMAYKSTAEVPLIIADTTATRLQDQPVEAGVIKRMGGDWVQVTFKNPFEDAPVVFTTLMSNRNFGENKGPAYPRVRNVTKEGFEVRITREDKLSSALWPVMGEEVVYYAIMPGTIQITDGLENETLHIVIARTPEVNGSLISTTVTQFPEGTLCPADTVPVIVSALQTCNDNYTSTLVYSQLTNSSVRFYKSEERSVSSGNGLKLKKDAVGYMLFYKTSGLSGIGSIPASENDFVLYEQDGTLHIEGLQGQTLVFYSSAGEKLFTIPAAKEVDVTDLPAGYYLVCSEKGEKAKFIKK